MQRQLQLKALRFGQDQCPDAAQDNAIAPESPGRDLTDRDFNGGPGQAPKQAERNQQKNTLAGQTTGIFLRIFAGLVFQYIFSVIIYEC